MRLALLLSVCMMYCMRAKGTFLNLGSTSRRIAQSIELARGGPASQRIECC